MEKPYKKLSIAAIAILAAALFALYLPAPTRAEVAAQPAKPATAAARLTQSELTKARTVAESSFAVRFLFTAEVLKPIFALKIAETAEVRVREQVSGTDVPFIAKRNKDGFCVGAQDGITFDAEKPQGVVRAQSGLWLAQLRELFRKNPTVLPIDPQNSQFACFQNVTRAFSFLANIVFDKSIVNTVLANGGAALAAALKPAAAPGPTAALFDFGDLPAPYPTTLAERGIRHRIGRVWLGGAPQSLAVDAEPDAKRPDNDRFDDGLALVRVATVPPPPDAVRVTRAPAPQGKRPLSGAFLNVLDDVNGNGRWEPNEWVVQNQAVRFPAGNTQTVSLQNPSNRPVVLSRKGGVRITVSLRRLQEYRGLAPGNQPLNGGETEDHLFGQKGGVPPICPVLPIPQCAEGMVSQTFTNPQGCVIVTCVPSGPTIDTGGLTPPPQTSGGSCGANQDCPSGQTCVIANNVGTCRSNDGTPTSGTSKSSIAPSDKCKPGESRCLSREQFQQCRKDGTWEVPQNCPIDTECDPGTGECTQTLRPTIPVAR